MNNLLSPLDGRYAARLQTLKQVMGEAALTRARIQVEAAYFILLCTLKLKGLPALTAKETAVLQSLGEPTEQDLQIIADIERKGYKNIQATNHDVKAIEYFIKDKLSRTSLKNRLEWIHFALTSEDINSVAYALLLSDGLEKVIVPSLEKILKELNAMAKKYAGTVMLARTHGQPAVPTTFGKEIKVFAVRLERQLQFLKTQQISCKFSGAVGSYNAHYAAFAHLNWPRVSKQLMNRLNKGRKNKLFLSEVTTQIDSHDTYAETFDALRRANVILIDFCQDIWRYISDGWVKQKPVAGEVGSSTMPQKINPIDFENAEGNLGLSNSLLTYFSEKLPISRLQRDLSDSTVLRNAAVAFGYAQTGFSAILKGLSKSAFDPVRAKAELLQHPEVLAEAMQTILRAEGVEKPYEKLKALTRGQRITDQSLRDFITHLAVSEPIKKKLRAVTIAGYIGIAARQAGGRK